LFDTEQGSVEINAMIACPSSKSLAATEFFFLRVQPSLLNFQDSK